jgi:hypothetical protein
MDCRSVMEPIRVVIRGLNLRIHASIGAPGFGSQARGCRIKSGHDALETGGQVTCKSTSDDFASSDLSPCSLLRMLRTHRPRRPSRNLMAHTRSSLRRRWIRPTQTVMGQCYNVRIFQLGGSPLQMVRQGFRPLASLRQQASRERLILRASW